MHANEAYVLEALRNGAFAYVLKDAPFEELVWRQQADRSGSLRPPARYPPHRPPANAETLEQSYRTVKPAATPVGQTWLALCFWKACACS